MATASQTVVMNVGRDEIKSVIVDFESYPQFVEGVHSAKTLSTQSAGEKRVQYGVSLLGKEIHYTLDHKEEGDTIRWNFVESNILKENSGSWTLKSLGPNKTEVRYEVTLEFKIYVPGMVLNGLVKSSLPKMLSSFEKKAQS